MQIYKQNSNCLFITCSFFLSVCARTRRRLKNMLNSFSVVLCFNSPCWTCGTFEKAINSKYITKLNSDYVQIFVKHSVQKRRRFNKRGILGRVRWYCVTFENCRLVIKPWVIPIDVFDPSCEFDDLTYVRQCVLMIKIIRREFSYAQSVQLLPM